ncbi:MAG: phage major capsid protein [Oscillospiraceae bacterium]|nr:phage major capsid protein [Oscillospiraceae bacterium]MBR2422021.1 phage major capsid protein [Oscillospiraceae bacterium]
MTREQYLNQRGQLMAKAKGFLDAGDMEQFDATKKEVEGLDAKYETEATAQANFAALQNPIGVPATLQNLGAPTQMAGTNAVVTDPYDTDEYKTAFMNFACRREPIPAKFLNAAASTAAADSGAVIPTTWAKEIVRNLKERGIIFQQLRHMNIQGGVEIPIADLMPVAHWVGEGASEDQKLSAKETVSFKYHGLECKIAQSLLVSIVTIDEFQNLFVELATEAIIAAVEIGVFKGSGNGQMLGVCKDPRVTKSVTMSPAEILQYAVWKRKVFGIIPKRYQTGKFYMAQQTFEGYIDGMVDQQGQLVGRTNHGIAGAPTFRFGGKDVETVEDDVLSPYDTAADDEVVAVFMNMKAYGFNSNMTMTVVHWTDHETNQKKTKVMLICDGKAIDTNGIILVKKGTSEAAASEA